MKTINTDQDKSIFILSPFLSTLFRNNEIEPALKKIIQSSFTRGKFGTVATKSVSTIGNISTRCYPGKNLHVRHRV